MYERGKAEGRVVGERRGSRKGFMREERQKQDVGNCLFKMELYGK